MAKRWYIVHAYSNFEKKVAESIRDQAKQRGLEEQFEQIMVPTEKVVEVRAKSDLDLLTLAWHIGNRHVPAEVTPDALYILYDHVLVDMLKAQGASTTIIERPFSPVRGAYHHHGEADLHGHSHD